MKSALIHGVLLAVMLVYGYRTWTRDKTVKPDLGSVVLWNKTESDLAYIEYKSDKKTVRLDRKGDKDAYWWGTETTIEKKPKPKPAEPKPAGSGSGSAAGSGSAGSGSAAKAGSGSGSAVAAGSGSAKAGSGSAVAAGSGSAKAGSGSAVAAGSGSAKAGSGSGSAVAAGSGSAKAGSGSGSAKTGSGSGSAVAQGSGSGSGSGSATPPTPPPPVEMVETTRKREFPLGDDGDKLVKGWTEARAISELASPTGDQLVEYKLATKEQIDAKLAEVKKELEDVKAQEAKDKEEDKDKDPKDKKKKKDDKKPELNKKIKDLEDQKKNADKPKPTITIGFTDGTTRVFTIGGNVFGATPDRYALDKSGTVYVLSKDMVADLEVGESRLQLKIPNGFDPSKEADQVEIAWGDRKKTAKRSQGGVDEKQVKTWVEEPGGKPNQPLATFIDNINNLRPTEYAKDVKLDGIQPVVRLEYKDAKGAKLGTLSLYKVAKAAVVTDPEQVDPANPKMDIDYYVVTERTRVPALVRKDPAQKSEEDLPIVFGDKAAPAAPVAPKPGANPFGNVPIPPHGGGSGKP